MRIDHLNFNVSSLEKSKEFYTRLLDFSEKEAGFSKSGVPYCILGHPERFYLCLYEQPQSIPFKGFNHFGVHVTDFEGLLEKLKILGVEINYGGVVDWPQGGQSAYIDGPDGEEIEFAKDFGGNLN
jgi:catechol 2,3-dioxygenase-like lactoylglutathione lyase family enzyme